MAIVERRGIRPNAEPLRDSARRSFALRRGRPDVQVALAGMSVDFGEFVRRKRQVPERTDTIDDLLGAARADERRGDASAAQNPCQRHLRQGLAAPFGDAVEAADAGDVVLVEEAGTQGLALS